MQPDVTMTVTDEPSRQRYELRRDDELLGFVDYRVRHDGVLVLPHAEIDPRRRGHGLGAHLVRGTLDHLRARPATVVPQCPFVARFIAEHPAYADLVAP